MKTGRKKKEKNHTFFLSLFKGEQVCSPGQLCPKLIQAPKVADHLEISIITLRHFENGRDKLAAHGEHYNPTRSRTESEYRLIDRSATRHIL